MEVKSQFHCLGHNFFEDILMKCCTHMCHNISGQDGGLLHTQIRSLSPYLLSTVLHMIQG